MDVSSFAISSDGERIALGDGPELLVYRKDGEPLWKHFCDGILLGVRFLGDVLAAVDTDGQVFFFRAADGKSLDRTRIDHVPSAVFASPDGMLGVVTSAGPIFVDSKGAMGGFPVLDLCAAAFGPDRSSVGLGTRRGAFIAMDASNGTAWGTIELGVPVTAVNWNFQGYWMVLAGTVIFRIDGGATTILGRQDLPAPPRMLTSSDDGAVGAVLYAGGQVGLLEFNKHTLAGELNTRRELHGIAFGRAATIGLGFDDGDASTVDLITRVTVRTEPHPGRGRNNWNLDLDFDGGSIRAAVTLIRSGNAAPELQRAPDEIAGGQRGWLGVGCLIINLMFMACAGCIGISAMLKYLKFI